MGAAPRRRNVFGEGGGGHMKIIHDLSFQKYFRSVPGRQAVGYHTLGELKLINGILTLNCEPFVSTADLEGGVWEAALAECIANDLGVPRDSVRKNSEFELLPGERLVVSDGGMGLHLWYYAVEVI